jgi:hypothetical protein
VWDHAEEVGLIVVVGNRKVPEDSFTIQPCVVDEVTGRLCAGRREYHACK